jgi:hypothetical protein
MNMDKAKLFLDAWVMKNIHDAVPPAGQAGAMHLAKLCLEAAKDQGLTQADLEAAAGEDLVACMMDAQVATADAKIGDMIEGAD